MGSEQWPDDLDLWPRNWWALLPVHVVDNLPTNSGVYERFRSWIMGQHLSDARTMWHRAILTFDLGGHGARLRWYRSSCFIEVRRPSSSVDMTHIRSQHLSACVTLTFDSETGARYCTRGIGNLPTNFGFSRTFHHSRHFTTWSSPVTLLVHI